MSLKLIVWDAGGTLVRTREKVGKTYAEVALRYGTHLDADRMHQNFKKSFLLLSNRKKGEIPTNGDDRAWWKKVVLQSMQGETSISQFDAFFEEIYLLFEDPKLWELMPGALEKLEDFQKRGIDQVVLSNWDARLHPILDGLGIGRFFKRRWISAECGMEKPDPDFYLTVLRDMQVNASEALMIGDHPINDDQAPRALGFQIDFVRGPEKKG